MNLLSFPFRLNVDGSVAVVEDGTDQARAEQIAVLLLTRRGERPLSPELGVTDMAGTGLDESEVAVAMATFLPDVDIRDIAIDAVGESTQQVRVTFD